MCLLPRGRGPNLAPLRPPHLQSQDLVASQVPMVQARPGYLEGTLHVSSWGSSAHPGFRTACTSPQRPGQVLLPHPPGQPPAGQAHNGSPGRAQSPELVTGLNLSAVHTNPIPRGSVLSLHGGDARSASVYTRYHVPLLPPSPFPHPCLGSLPHWELPPPQDGSQALTLLPTGPARDRLGPPSLQARHCRGGPDQPR